MECENYMKPLVGQKKRKKQNSLPFSIDNVIVFIENPKSSAESLTFS